MLKKKIIIFLIVLFISSIPALAAENQEINDNISSMANKLIEDGKAKGTVLSIIKNGEVILCKGFGFADEYNNIPADGKLTAFRIGSVSKTFVAAAAQILNQQGKLDMNSDISVYLESDFPKLKYPVTMHQLLTHTAGFEELITGIAVLNVSDTEPLSVSVRKYMPEQIFKPDKVSSYSNYGIALAAYVVEAIAEVPFAKFCTENIFLPLDMNRTTYEYMHDVVYVSKAYLPDGRETAEPYINLYPEGSAVSTAEDTAKYMKWLLNDKDNRILSEKYKNELFEKQFAISEEWEGTGYVWSRRERNDKIYHDKKGETLNFYTRIALYPEENTGIFLSFNTYVPENEINAIMMKATDLIYGKQEEKIPDKISSSIDIRGIYVNNWSSIKTPEKILSYLIPGKMLYIKETGGEFLLNGEKITLIGNDTFSSSMGKIKFNDKSGNIIIATESAVTYSKVSFLQSKIIQTCILFLFVISAFICFIKSILHKKAAFIAASLIQILSFLGLCILLLKGIQNYSILKYSYYMNICGWLIALSGAAGIVYTVLMKRNNDKISTIYIGWNLESIIFIAWLLNFNII